MWRGGVNAAYRLPALSSAGASLATPCFRFHIPLRSLTLRPACSPGRLRDPLHQRLQQSRCLPCCSDCYRVERTSSRAGYPRCGPAPSRRTRFGVNQMDLEQIAITKRRKHNQQLFPFTTSMNKNLKNVVYALFAGCFGGLLLP